MSETHRIALGLEYIGTNFNGFQRQKGTRNTIQQNIEEALSSVANHKVKTFCSGRTDSGVHAYGQVIHFDTNSLRTSESWVKGTNSNLPSQIKAIWAKETSEGFHARFSAISRHYRYLIRNSEKPSVFLNERSWWIQEHLEITKMREASRYLIGENDFNAFRNSGCQSNSSNRNITSLKIDKSEDLIILDIKANAFLLNMVRIIAGTLVDVAKEKMEPRDVKKILESKDRRRASKTAPSAGLYFIGPKYETKEGIPTQKQTFLKLN